MSINKATKMKKGKGRFLNRPTRTGKRIYDRFFIYVPTEVARDGLFPFQAGDAVSIEIKGDTLVIRKAKKIQNSET